MVKSLPPFPTSPFMRVHTPIHSGFSWRMIAPRVDDLPVTQRFLALTLCVYRPSVAVIASTLQAQVSSGAVAGPNHCLDRNALEATAGDCYAAVQRRLNILLGFGKVLQSGYS